MQAICCQEKFQFIVTVEAIEKNLNNQLEYLKAALFHQSRPFWMKHYPVKGMIGQYANGTWEINADPGQYADVELTSKYTYYPYSKTIKWMPGPAENEIVDKDTYMKYKSSLVWEPGDFIAEGPIDYISLMQKELTDDLNQDLAFKQELGKSYSSKTKGYKQLSAYYNQISLMKKALLKTKTTKPVKFFVDKGGSGKHIVVMADGQKFFFETYYDAQKAIQQACGTYSNMPYTDAKKNELLGKIKGYDGPGWSPKPMLFAAFGEPAEVKKLPGLDTLVKHPVVSGKFSIKTLIMDLNDNHGWTREQIADWLETLDVDLRFK
jgi:hypothetical protein